jgi:hypothetical protein
VPVQRQVRSSCIDCLALCLERMLFLLFFNGRSDAHILRRNRRSHDATSNQ